MKWMILTGIVVVFGIVTGVRLRKRGVKPEQTKEDAGGGYLCRQDVAAVVKHNTLMNGVTSSRGESLGIIQEDRLFLNEDGTFTLRKELKSTRTNLLLKEPVRVTYKFQGTYTRAENKVELSKAVSGTGDVDWGTISRFLDTGNGTYDSTTSPGILSLYPTAFFVERCKNVPMVVHLDERNASFVFEEFEPIILSEEEAGAVQTQIQEMDLECGLMNAALVENPSDYVLKDVFAEQGMRVGTCINPAYLEEPYVSILKTQFCSVTLENHLKPAATLCQEKSRRSGRLSVEFSPETVKLLNWCKENGMPVRGHTLIWYMGTPEWVFHEGYESDAANVGRDEMLRRMKDYIQGFFVALSEGGWEKMLYCIDVVNEAVIAPSQMRKCPWQEIIGEDYVWHAYHFARKYAPANIRLCYNDFDLETKTEKVIELVNGLKDEDGKKMVDIVGQQGHYGAYSNTDSLMDALEKIGRETGCELQITELDVSVSRQGTEEELKLQGRFYYHFVQQVLKLRQKGVWITGITLWGFADALSWMPSGHLHLYDRNMVLKYAFFGMLGIKELAGFDGEEMGAQGIRGLPEGQKELCFTVEGEEEKFVRLEDDGTYTDTTAGSKITGSYVFDGTDTYMLTPKAGGYANLTMSEDGNSAVRVEAAGGKTRLRRSEKQGNK